MVKETVDAPMDRPPRAPATRARLSVVYPPDRCQTIPLTNEELVIGRDPGDDGVAIDDGTVSRSHFAMRWSERLGHHTGADLGSRNGTRIDGRRVGQDTRPLVDGSVVRLGSVLLVYERESQPTPGESRVADVAVIGASLSAERLGRELTRAADDAAPLLLIGETGTGKEVLAREAHRLSKRTGEFVAINCAALSAQLVESQLFGHRRGAFTGAASDHEGVFRAADGGTLLLDEIGELPPEIQPKLLRVLQEREVHPVGATHPVSVDVRVVAATLVDVAASAEHGGGFRLDLYARLAAWEIRVPPLRERRADLLAWVHHFHTQWQRGRELPESAPRLDADAAERILLHGWSDNLRGIERLVNQNCRLDPSAPYTLGIPEADIEVVTAATPSPEKARKKRRPRPSREELERVLHDNGGSVRATAKHFDRERRQIYRWLDHYGLKSTSE